VDAILRLPDIERLVFTLYYYEELTTKEIELVLGETESSVSAIHDSALLLLYARLSEPEEMI
jgi:RNA polymerase sigma factor FliA